MRSFFLNVFLVATLAMPVACVTAAARPTPNPPQADPAFTCSDQNLKGVYAFTIWGDIFVKPLTFDTSTTPPTPVPAIPLAVDGTAMTYFDGAGALSQVDYVMRNGMPAITPSTPVNDNGFRTQESGTYTVNPDCTGSAIINFPDGSEIDLKFTLADQGRKIHTVVSRMHLPTPVPFACQPNTSCDTFTAIRSDGVRFEPGPGPE